MPDGSYHKKYVLCPFYKHDDFKTRALICESIMPGTFTTRFTYKRDFEFHLKNYCECNYKYCEVYRMVMAAKYE